MTGESAWPNLPCSAAAATARAAERLHATRWSCTAESLQGPDLFTAPPQMLHFERVEFD